MTVHRFDLEHRSGHIVVKGDDGGSIEDLNIFDYSDFGYDLGHDLFVVGATLLGVAVLTAGGVFALAKRLLRRNQ